MVVGPNWGLNLTIKQRSHNSDSATLCVKVLRCYRWISESILPPQPRLLTTLCTQLLQLIQTPSIELRIGQLDQRIVDLCPAICVRFLVAERRDCPARRQQMGPTERGTPADQHGCEDRGQNWSRKKIYMCLLYPKSCIVV